MSARPQKVDVVVVGAGPAGLVVAAQLAAAGRSVRLLDAGDAARCLESLDGRAADVLRYLGLDRALEAEGAPMRTALRIQGADRRPALVLGAPRVGARLPRPRLRTRLLALAAERGVVRLPGRATRAVVEDGQVGGCAYRPLGAGPERRLSARLLIDATGPQAFLSRQGVAGPRQVEGPGRLVTVRVPLRFDDPGGTEDLLLHGEPLHWGWLRPGGRVPGEGGIGVPHETWRRHGASANALLDAAGDVHPVLGERLAPRWRVGEPEVAEIWPCQVVPAAGSGWLCVGESARVSDPVFELGLGLAMVEALEAARAAVRLLDGEEAPAVFSDYLAYVARGRDAAADLARYFWRFPGFFASRASGELRPEFERLLDGDLHTDPPLAALSFVRRSLRGEPAGAVAGPLAREIARRVRLRCQAHAAVSAAFLEVSEDGALVSLVLDDAAAGDDDLHDVEEALYQEFGRAHLAVVRWSDDARRGLSPPEFGTEQVIFDRRVP